MLDPSWKLVFGRYTSPIPIKVKKKKNVINLKKYLTLGDGNLNHQMRSVTMFSSLDLQNASLKLDVRPSG